MIPPALHTWGFLAWSDIARRRVYPALCAMEGHRILAIGRRDLGNRAPWVPAEIPIRDYEGILRDPTIESVYLSMENGSHEDWVLRALHSGKHVLCEKPVGLDPQSVQRMVDAAQATGRVLYEVDMYAHHPQHAQIQRFVTAAGLGALRGVQMEYAFELKDVNNIRYQAAGGGACHDLLTYVVATADWYLTPNWRPVRGGLRRSGFVDVEAWGGLEDDRGVQVDFRISFCRDYACFYRLHFDQGSLTLNRAFTPPAEYEPFAWLERNNTRESIPLRRADQFVLMLREYVQVVRTPSLRRGLFDRMLRRAENIGRIRSHLSESSASIQAGV